MTQAVELVRTIGVRRPGGLPLCHTFGALRLSSVMPKRKTTPISADNKESIVNATQLQQRFPKLAPKPSLQVTELEPNQIYLIHNYFTAKECGALIRHFESSLRLRTVPAIPKPGEAFRSNDRDSFNDAALAEKLWRLGLDKACQTTPGIAQVSLPRQPVGLNSNLRVYRYRVGQVRTEEKFLLLLAVTPTMTYTKRNLKDIMMTL